MQRGARPDGLRSRLGQVLLLCAVAAVAVPAELAGDIPRAMAVMASAPAVPCNLGDAESPLPRDARVGARGLLIPPGAVSLTVCAYNGTRADQIAPAFGLVGSGASTNRRRIGRLTAALNRLKSPHTALPCPMDQGNSDVATFDYPSGPSVVITVDTGGCGVIDNGHIRRLALGAPIATEIGALTTPVVGVDWPTFAGHLRLCGGPVAGRCFIANFDGDDRIVASDARGRAVAMVPVRHGRFHLRVAAPGTYTLALYAGNGLENKQQRSATWALTTTVVFLIPIK